MIIPKKDPERRKFLKYVLDICTSTMNERANMYDYRRKYYLFGNYQRGNVRYNRLFSHTDLVCSFLYAADHVKFTVAAPRHSPTVIVDQLRAVQEHWNDDFRDSGLAYGFTTALQWATVLDSYFIKLAWNRSREQLQGALIPPHQMGVFDESKIDLDDQEAFTHTYLVDWDNAKLRLERAGLRDEIKRMQDSAFETPTIYPNTLAQLIITGGPGQVLTNNVTGQINQNYRPFADYEPKTMAPKVEWCELYIWDDEANPNEHGEPQGDYACFLIAEPDIVVEDSREKVSLAKEYPGRIKGAEKIDCNYGSTSNLFLVGEHPFVHIRPYEMPGFFWGECHTDRLIPLQDWTNDELNSIAEILEEQRDPPKVVSGAMGLQDEKMDALSGPGAWIADQLPGFKVERLAREMPPDLFASFKSIGEIFIEASGLTATITGQGEQGVRGKAHAKQLATTGSSRIRKVAVALEQPLTQLADKGLRIKQREDDTHLLFKEGSGNEFVLAQVATEWKVRVAGHSHSPLFADEAREMAALLLKAKAIDREMFISLLHPPEEQNMLHDMQRIKREEANAAQVRLLAGAAGAHRAAPRNGATPPD